MTHCQESDCIDKTDCHNEHEGTCLELETNQGIFRYKLDCGEVFQTAYETALNVLPDTPEDPEQDYDTLTSDTSRVVWINSWMSDPPDHVLDEDCGHHCGAGPDGRCDDPITGCCVGFTCDECKWGDYYTVQPDSVSLAAQQDYAHNDTFDDYDLHFGIPTKDDVRNTNSSDESAIEDIIVPAIAAVASSVPNPVAKAAGAAASLYVAWSQVDNDPDQEPFKMTRTTYNGNQIRLLWENIPIEGDQTADLPQGPCDTSEVAFRINDLAAPKDQCKVGTYSQFSWETLTYRDGGSECPDCRNHIPEPVFVEGPVVQNTYVFEITDS